MLSVLVLCCYMVLVCPFCAGLRYNSQEILRYLAHIKLHSHYPNFLVMCGICGCKSYYTNYRLFREHVHEKHRQSVSRKSIDARTENTGNLVENFVLD